MTGKTPTTRSTSQDVSQFLKTAASMPMVAPGSRGRLIFAMDATASRGPTWREAMGIQTEMFREAATTGGGLSVQLVYYRGIKEFGASPWIADAAAMVSLMQRITFLSGQTQLERVLRHAAEEARREKVAALVFIGDAMEESADLVAAAAGKLGVLGVPAFMFHEGGGDALGAEPARSTFQRVAELTRGAYAPFDSSSPQQLRDLLTAVAVYATGGRKALADFGAKAGGMALKLTHQLGGKK